MSQPPLRRPSSPSFSPRYVAFLDVLGFENLVRQADTDISARKTVRSAIGILRGANNDREDAGYEFTHFSDSIVLSADVTAVGARAVIESCCRLSVLLLRRGLLLRGGLTVGNVIHEPNGMLYGSGMIDAYKLDQRNSPPRIAVTDAALKAIEESCTEAFRKRYLQIDDYDLSSMIHVLQEFARLSPRTKVLVEKRPVANEIARLIAQQSFNEALQPDVRAKWRWLRNYWNRVMTIRGLVDAADLTV